MRTFNLLCISVFLLLGVGCSKSNDKEILRYFRQSNDTLSLHAYSFLRENLSEEDLERWTIDKQFLIHDIENAVSQCKPKLESGKMPFSYFCEYILPLCIDFEPIEDWRIKCQKKFLFTERWRLVNVCDTINNLLSKNFSFSNEILSSAYMSWSYLDTLKKGDCFHMAKSVLYPLRALGHPVTIDFTPCWGNTKGAHSWNVVYVDGKMIPFMGREKSIFEYKPFRVYYPDDFKPSANFLYYPHANSSSPYPDDSLHLPIYRYPAKVYRKTFSMNRDLQQKVQNIDAENLPALFGDCRIQDVSAEYFPVTDIILKSVNGAEEHEPIYLAVFSNDWSITAIAESKKDSIVFKDVKTEMLYMPVVYRKGLVLPIQAPFVVDKETQIHNLNLKKGKESCIISYTLPLHLELSEAVAKKKELPTDIADRLLRGERRQKPINGVKYRLLCWNFDKWTLVDEQIAINNELVFSKVPEDALFYLADNENNFIGRCFTIDEGEIKWW